MIVITGAAGFIGSCLVSKLNEDRYFDLILVDDFSKKEIDKNLEGKIFKEKVDRMVLEQWIDDNQNQIQFIFHIGARTDTTEFNQAVFDELNLNYSKMVWNKCVEYGLPLVYASSAATYGLGEQGYEDDENRIPQLQPLNPYGHSKNDFDIWALSQERKPYFWAGLKFFNVYGPNEYHKGRMASVIFHGYNQIKTNGVMRLFRSHNPNYSDGGQMRDFVYVKDVVSVCHWLMHNRKHSGIYNLGSGQARSFLDLAKATFFALELEANIEFIDTPMDIRDKYQYFTEAKMEKLISVGYPHSFTSLEDGVKDYVQNYLATGKIY